MPKHAASRSITNRFTRDYLIISIIPIAFLLILIITGAVVTRNYLAYMIEESTYDLNSDAEKSLQALGEEIIRTKARDVARQIEMYFRMHPGKTFAEMRKDPLFMELALQRVGKTGYTAITEARKPGDKPTDGLEPVIFRVHEKAQYNDRDMGFLGKAMPSWWFIAKRGLDGVETAGYYDWQEPDGTVRQKYLAVTPVQVKKNGVIIMVSATTYIDEFSVPIRQMRQKADIVVGNYQQYISDQLLLFSLLAAMIILLTFYGIFYLGRRAGLRHILPITELAEAAKHLGEGNWNVQIPDQITGRLDEIGVTGQSFNRMSLQLKDSFQNLEKRLNDLHEAEDALKKSEEHFRTLYEESRRAQEVYRSLINSSADAMVICDLEGRVTYLSPMFTKLFGWNTEELTGKPVAFVPEEEKERSLAVIWEVIKTGIPCQGFETRRNTREGRIIDVSISASRYNDHEGQPAGILVILRDISEAKKMKAHMEQVARLEAIGTLAGGIAHDFNNLLMVIQGIISLLIYNTQNSDPDYNHYVDIEKQVQRGAKLTRQLLGYARKGKYEVRPVNLNEITVESAETLRRTRKDIRLYFQLDPTIRAVEADIYQMEQVLMNLYINAADAMPNGGDLTLTTKNTTAADISQTLFTAKEGPYVLLTMEDTGIGMDKKTQDRIFEPFFTTKAVDKGTGLGLASAYGIVKGHGGYITVRSEVGKGSVFSIYLPASDKSFPDKINHQKKTLQGRGTILLIDDEKPVLDAASAMLRSIGYDTLLATHGRRGLEIFEKEAKQIDLVILDMVMPDMNGGEVFDRLRAIHPDVRVLLASGFSIEGRAADILDRGCNGFIQKPFSLEDLAEKINSIVTP
ncbi:MAG: PAS domain S-box protein [Smithellaceae bacterium]